MFEDQRVYPVEHEPPVAVWTPIGATFTHANPVPSGIVPEGQEMLETQICKFEGTTTVPAAQFERHLLSTKEYPEGQFGVDILFCVQSVVYALRIHQYVLARNEIEVYTKSTDSPTADKEKFVADGKKI